MLFQFFINKSTKKTTKVLIYLQKGSGLIQINNKSYYAYFKPIVHLTKKKSKIQNIFFYDKNIFIFIHGSGIKTQFLALSISLWKLFNCVKLYFIRTNNLLTTNSKKVERKKYGLKKARKASQYSKR